MTLLGINTQSILQYSGQSSNINNLSNISDLFNMSNIIDIEWKEDYLTCFSKHC